MMLSNKTLRTSLTLATALFAGLSPLALHAQHAAADTDTTATPNIFVTSTPSTMDLAATSGLNYSSSTSSTDVAVDPDTAGTLNLGESAQPPPRRRYGTPRYNDSSHNPDGSAKWEFAIGGGFTAPIGNTYHYLNTSYDISIAGGRDFSKKLGVLIEYNYDRFGFNGRTLGNQTSLYNYYCTPALALTGACPLTGLDGNSHVWEFNLEPHFNFFTGDSLGAYVLGGVGFAHKTANFTVPAQGTYCDYYYGCYTYQANQTIDKYTSNAPAFNGGVGMTFKPSRFASQRLFVEGRYNIMLNSQRYGITVNSPPSVLNSYAGYNYYPANSNRTTWLVFKAGIRF
jgi:hypothetical protein